MTISLNENVTFTSRHNKLRRARTQEEKDRDKKVVTGGGAIVATTTAAKTKAARSGFDMFSSASKVSNGITTSAKTASNVAKQTKGLWGKVVENTRWAKNAILNWGKNIQNSKFLKPLVNSKLFKFGAGTLGYGFGIVTLISGLSDIGKVTTDAIEKQTHRD